MKKISLVLLPIILFLFSCEINDAGGDTTFNLNEGIQLKWIGQNGDLSDIYYTSSIPSVPSNWNVRFWHSTQQYYENDRWQYEFECVEIKLFQSLGYFNYRLKGDDTTYIFTKSIIDDGVWGWEEETTIEQTP